MRSSYLLVFLLVLLLCGCRQKASISGVLYPDHPLRLNETAELAVMLASPSGDEVLRWEAANGKCESKDAHALSCRYLARRAGEDTVTVEVLRSGQVIAKTSVRIQVDSSASGASTPPASKATDLDEAEIVVTEKPPFGVGGPEKTAPISGRVSGIAGPERFNLVLYAYASPLWYVQPRVNAPITEIDRDGLWATDTHLGSEYAILLVLPSYTDPPPTVEALPRGPEVLKILRLRNQN